MRHIDAVQIFQIQKLKADIERKMSNNENADELVEELFDKMIVHEGTTSTLCYNSDEF